MRLLVTGGSGFLGGQVLAEAARQGHECVALARSVTAAETVAARGAAPLAGDLRDPGLARIFASARCEALVNLASLGFGHAPAIVSAAQAAGLARAIFISTTAVITTLPAASKRVRLAAEEMIRLGGLDWTILRPTMIYGTACDRNMSRLLTALARARWVPALPLPGSGQRLQQPVHVADVASAVLACARRPQTAGLRYDVAGPAPMPFGDLLRAAADAVGCRARFVSVPLRPVITMTRGYERVSRHPRIRAEQLQRLAEDKAFAIDAAARDLGYAPRSFRDGIRAEAVALGLAASRSPAEAACLALP
jgi:nucleoside-diphosphate-sugar epimerase